MTVANPLRAENLRHFRLTRLRDYNLLENP